VTYPVACAPQAWSAGIVFLLLQGCLVLTVNAQEGRTTFLRPSLPAFLSEVRISNLAVKDGAVDLLVVRHKDDVSVHVLRQAGTSEVIVVP
jgi:glycogen debranching enzyme